ncbi:MAG: ferritin family protein [Smithellaceae bacterium]
MGKYNVDEMLAHAMEIEQAGEKFYAVLAERLENPQLKKIFSLMSRQEVEHDKVYQQLRDQLSGTPGGTPDQEDQFDFKQHEMLEDRIFNRLEVVRKTPKLKTLGDALAFMIDIEMDVVDYFENIRKLVSPKGQSVMERIINEEKTHVKQLVDLRTQYKSALLR